MHYASLIHITDGNYHALVTDTAADDLQCDTIRYEMAYLSALKNWRKGQFNLAHETKNGKMKKKLKTKFGLLRRNGLGESEKAAPGSKSKTTGKGKDLWGYETMEIVWLWGLCRSVIWTSRESGERRKPLDMIEWYDWTYELLRQYEQESTESAGNGIIET